MPRVFISYSSADIAFVEMLAAKLRTAGVAVWYDRWEIRVGDSIIQKINDGIQSSDFLIAILSKNSVTSKWVKEELAVASMLTLSKGAFVLPVLLEKCDIPPFLAHRRYANFADDPQQALQELLRAINSPIPHVEASEIPVSDEDKARLDAATTILSLFINGYEDGTQADKQKIEEEVRDKYKALSEKWRMSQPVYSFYIKTCIEEKRILHVTEFMERIVEFVTRHKDVANDVFLWCLKIVAG
jgi:hypothetical protein